MGAGGGAHSKTTDRYARPVAATICRRIAASPHTLPFKGTPQTAANPVYSHTHSTRALGHCEPIVSLLRPIWFVRQSASVGLALSSQEPTQNHQEQEQCLFSLHNTIAGTVPMDAVGGLQETQDRHTQQLLRSICRVHAPAHCFCCSPRHKRLIFQSTCTRTARALSAIANREVLFPDRPGLLASQPQ